MQPSRFLFISILITTLAHPAFAGLKNSDCMDCHSDNTLAITNAAGRAISLFVDEARLKASAHKTNTCVSCHADVTVKHPDDNVPLKPVNCATCHEQQTESYNASVHGLAAKAGHRDAATCQDCHDSHEIVPANLPASPLHYSRLAQTCGACHDQEVRDWAMSVHGQALAAGTRDAPTCTDCHSEHKIQALKNTSPEVSAEVCSRCHASERLNTKYNLPADRVKTFFESYHGLAVQYGSTVAANCGSCHGYHKILPSTDPRSTINKAHLVETCGKCHPGADEKFASGKIHVDLAAGNGGTDFSAKINRWVRRVYLVLIFGTIGAMFIHNALLFLRKVAARYRVAVRPVMRMSLAQRWQHFVLAASFIILAVTGFALKFPDSWLARALGSSEPFRRWTHRIAGIVLLLVGLWHLIYLLSSKDGRRLVCDLFPVKKDMADVLGANPLSAGLEHREAEDRPVRVRREAGILGGDLGHHHHGRDRAGDLVQAGRDPVPAALGRGCGIDHSLLRSCARLPGDNRVAFLPRHLRPGRLPAEPSLLGRPRVGRMAKARASAQ